jgi:hypothetical protein
VLTLEPGGQTSWHFLEKKSDPIEPQARSLLRLGLFVCLAEEAFVAPRVMGLFCAGREGVTHHYYAERAKGSGQSREACRAPKP